MKLFLPQPLSHRIDRHKFTIEIQNVGYEGANEKGTYGSKQQKPAFDAPRVLQGAKLKLCEPESQTPNEPENASRGKDICLLAKGRKDNPKANHEAYDGYGTH